MMIYTTTQISLMVLKTNSDKSQDTEEQRKRYIFRMKLPNDQTRAVGIKKAFKIIFRL